MKILVTGATGFIGGALCGRLQNQSWPVVAYTRKTHGDLRDYHAVKKTLRGVDVVVNCAAALPHHKLPDRDYWDTNVTGVKNVVAACLENRIKRLVHVSTVGIYGSTPRAGLDERAPAKVSDIYTQTKFVGDKLVWQYIADGGDAVIIRPTIAYGPGDVRPVFLKLFRLIRKGINISIGPGDNYLHTIYIDNLVDALILAIKKNAALGTDFIIGDEVCPTMRQIVKTIAKVQQKKFLNLVVPKTPALLVGKIAGLERTIRFASEDRHYSIKKAKQILGYRPKIRLERGMQMTYDWYRVKGLL